MIIAGIDPGIALCGYGVIDYQKKNSKIIEVGCIKTEKGKTNASRLAEIRADIIALLPKFQIELIALEELFFFRNAKTIIGVAQARGVVLEAVHTCGIQKIVEFTPMQVKKEIADYGKADKKEMQEAVKNLLGLDDIIKPDDANDAVAVALCAGRRLFASECEQQHTV